MAIYHCSVSVGSRSNGSSSVASASYRSGSEMTNDRTGEIHDYSRKEGVDFSEIMAPKNSPEWVTDREKLWNNVEASEKRKDAQLYREVEVAFPRELTKEQMQELVKEFAKKEFVDKGMVADINIHHANGDNPHAHIMLTTREITTDGFGQKNRDWNSKENLQTWRESWEKHANNALEKAGHEQRIDHRTLEAQGIERIPQIHLGIKVLKMEERGVSTDRGSQALEIERDNAKLHEMKLNRDAIREVIDGGSRKTEGRENRERASGADRATGTSDGRTDGRDAASGWRVEGGNQANIERLQEGREVVNGQHARAGQGENAKTGASRAEFGGANEAAKVEHGYSHSDDIAHKRAAVERIVSLASQAGRGSGSHQNADLHARESTKGEEINGKPDRTYLAVRRQIGAMGAKSYDVGIRNKEGEMMTRTWTSDEVLKAVPWLKRENALGADIYIRPAGEMNQGIVLVDDLNLGGLAKLKANGMDPATVLETSPNNYQAWVRLSDSPMRNEYATAIARDFAKEYNGDPNSADWRHFGRLAGFTNQKPKHMTEDGKRPWVLSHESSGKVASRGGEVMSNLDRQWKEHELVKAERERERGQVSQNRATRTKTGDPIAEFQKQMKGLETRYGASIDYSRADYMIAVDMARKGYSKDQVAGAMNQSPGIDSRKAGHQDDYVARTVDAGFKRHEKDLVRQRDQGLSR